MGILDTLGSMLRDGLLQSRTEKEIPLADTSSVTGSDITRIGYGGSDTRNKKKLISDINGWSYACISAISDEVAMIDLRLYERQADGSTVEVTESPILDILFKVNQFTTRFDHFWLTQTYLESVGEAPWFIDKNEFNQVTAIYFLQPFKLKPLVDQKSNHVIGYKYQLDDGTEIPIPIDDVIFLKYPDPSNPFRGKGPMQAALETILVDLNAEQWNKSFFVNSAKPSTVIHIKNKQNMTKEQKDKLLRSFEQKHKGVEKAHETVVLFGDMELTTFGATHKDMDFNEQQKYARDKIMGIFRVPKAILAQTEGVNFASSKTAEYTFTRFVIKPKMERLVQQLNEFLLPMFLGSENLYLDYSSPVQDDEEDKLKRYESGLKNGWLAINEVRSSEGLPVIEGGDSLYVPANVIAVGSVNMAENKSMIPYAREKQMVARSKGYFDRQKNLKNIKEDIKKKLRLELNKRKTKNFKDVDVDEAVQWDEATKTSFMVEKEKIFDAYHPGIEKQQVKIFEGQNERVKKLVRSVFSAKKMLIKKDLDDDAKINDVLLNEESESDLYLLLMYPLFFSIFDAAAKETVEFIGRDDVTFDTSSDSVKSFLERNTTKLAKEVTSETNKKIKKTLREGLEDGESTNKLVERINKVFDEATDVRAQRIARTEASRYNVEATQRVFEESKVVVAKEWVINPATACEFCRTMDGKIIGLSGSFFKKGDTLTGQSGGTLKLDYETVKHPPLHPNCNCDLAPIIINSQE